MQVKKEGDKLHIVIDIATNPAPSKSGKTLVVASSHGCVKTDVQINGKPVIVGVNAYISK